MPTYSITTYGCQMNKNDSERMAGLLGSLGFSETSDESTADLIVVNTCSVRQSAEDRVFGSQEKYLEYKKTKPDMIVAVTGCMPGRDKAKNFRDRLPGTDLYFPTPDMVHLPRWIAELRPELVNSDELEADYLKIHPQRAPGAQAFLTIQTGCNKFCTYCVVPYARGLEKNRPLEDILNEARELISHGVIEITLLGQTVNSHPQFATILRELNAMPGLERLHWTAAHPNSMTDEVIACLALPKQVNYLHLPVQCGSNEVLRRMNRKYTREQFLDVIKKVKVARPGIALGSDIIVGFPGETREQFKETLSLYEEVGFDISYNAQYSPRSGTLGVKLYQDDISKEEKRDRWDELQVLMEKIALEKNKAFIGKQVNVLVEKVDNGYASGNSHEMKLVRFPAKGGSASGGTCDDASLVGKIVPVTVNAVKSWVLEGELSTRQG